MDRPLPENWEERSRKLDKFLEGQGITEPLFVRGAWNTGGILQQSAILQEYLTRLAKAEAEADPKNPPKVNTGNEDLKRIPASLLGLWTARLLGCCVAAQIPPPRELADAIAYQLGAHKFGFEGTRRTDALVAARLIKAQEPSIGVSELARRVGVNKSQISRWIKAGKL